MKKQYAVVKKLLFPPKWVFFSIVPVVFAALAGVFAAGQNDSAIAYPIYVMSAYCLLILIVPLPKVLRNIKAYFVKRINAVSFGKKYLGDPAFRGSVGIYQGMTVNFLYVIFRVAVGIRYASMWFISMAVYYLVLGIIRLSLIVSYRNRDRINERRCYRRTAWLLFLLNVPMGGMIFLMVMTNSGFFYPGYVIYLSAMYTFYIMTVSVVNLVKYYNYGSPVMSAAKVLNFIAALMSILGLQTAMIAQFSENGSGFGKTMNAVTGGCVWITVILTAVYMLHRSKKMKYKDEVKTFEQIRK